ncbi:hypothetical protein D3C77_641310 [compost metagenome]
MHAHLKAAEQGGNAIHTGGGLGCQVKQRHARGGIGMGGIQHCPYPEPEFGRRLAEFGRARQLPEQLEESQAAGLGIQRIPFPFLLLPRRWVQCLQPFFPGRGVPLRAGRGQQAFGAIQSIENLHWQRITLQVHGTTQLQRGLEQSCR